MPNNIAVSITADVADLQVKRAIASAEVKTLQKDLDNLARTAKTSGLTDELRTGMLAAADGAQKARNTVALLDREVRSLSAGARGAETAMSALHGGSAGVTRELIVLGREASRGNFSRMAGSATILAQRMGLLTPEVLLAAGAIAALVAPIVAVAAATESSQADLARFQNDVELTGNFAGLTAEDFEAMARRVAAASNTGIGSARAALAALVASGRFTGVEIEELGRDAEKMSQLTGEAAKQVLADFVKMADGPTHYAEEFNRAHHALTAAQLEHIANLEAEGQKSEATAELVRDLTTWLDDQKAHMGGLAGAWHGLATAIDNAWESFKRFNAGPTREEQIAQKQAQLKSLQTSGSIDGDHYYGAQRAEYIATLQREIAALQAKGDADKKAAQAAADASRTQEAATEAYQKSHATLQSLKSSAEQAREAVRALHEEMAARLRANPNDAEAEDYMAHHARYDAALMHRMDPGDFKKPRAEPKESPLVGMEAELRQQELQIEQQTGDWQKDMSGLEARFWEEKLATAKGNAKLYAQIYQRMQQAQLAGARADAEQARQISQNNISTGLSLQKSQIGDERSGVEAQSRIAIRSDEQGGDYGAAAAAAQQKHDRLVELAQDEARAEVDAAEATARAQGGTAVAANEAANKRLEIEANLKSQIDEINRRLTADLAAEQEKRTHAAQEAARKQAESWRGVNSEVLSAESRLVSGVISGRESMSQILHKIAIDTVEKEIEADLRYLTQSKLFQAEKLASSQMAEKGGILIHLAGEAQKTAATAAGTEARVATTAAGSAQSATISSMENVREVTGAAAVAAANAYKAMAGIPVVGPFLGAAAAATTFAAVEAYGTMASLAVGTNYVPNDMVAQIHQGERVIPAADNKQIMSIMARGAGAGSSKGDLHQHITYAPQLAGPTKSFRQQLQDHASDLVAMVRTAARNGAFG